MPNACRTSSRWDQLVRHLGYEPSNACDAGTPRDIEIIEESQRRLAAARPLEDHELTPRQAASLKLARQIVADITNGSGPKVAAAEIPPASDQVSTAGVYSSNPPAIFISADQLERGESAVYTAIHEGAHHTSQEEDGEPAFDAEVKRLAERVVRSVKSGNYRVCLKDRNFAW